MKTKVIIMVLFLLPVLSCDNKTTKGSVTNTNPQLNTESFTNYVPWWATNNAATNEVKK